MPIRVRGRGRQGDVAFSARCRDSARQAAFPPLFAVCASIGHNCAVSRKPWVHSSVVRAAGCRSAGPWLKSGCALICYELGTSTAVTKACNTWSTSPENVEHERNICRRIPCRSPIAFPEALRSPLRRFLETLPGSGDFRRSKKTRAK